MGEPQLIEQAYRFALRPTPEQERFLEACAGASRFFYNWGLGLVETRLRRARAYGPSVSVPWSYKELCSEFAKVKHDVAPWRSEVVVGSQQAGLGGARRGLAAVPRRAPDGQAGLQRLLERDEHARVKRATVQRQGSKWYVSFTVGHSPKRRRVRQPRVAVGVDVGIRQLATLSTGEQVQNLRPCRRACGNWGGFSVA